MGGAVPSLLFEVKWSHSVLSTLCDPVDCSLPWLLPSRQEYWSGLPFPSPVNLPHPGIEPGSPALSADALPSEPPGKSVMKIMVTSLKRSHECTAALSAPNPAAGHRWPMPPRVLPDTHRQVWDSLQWAHCYFILGPGAQVSVVPSKSLFPSPV